MKGFNLILLVFFIQVTFSSTLHGQKHQIGVDLGYGSTKSISDKNRYYLPNYKSLRNFVRTGLQYYYKPGKKNILLLTGINFDYNYENNINLAYFRIPLGVEAGIGKSIRLIYGGGFYLSYLIFYTGIDEYSDFEESVNKIQIGAYGNLGIEYQISNRYSVGLGLQSNVDFIKLYEEYTTSPGGSTYPIREGYGADFFVKLNLKHAFAIN